MLDLNKLNEQQAESLYWKINGVIHPVEALHPKSLLPKDYTWASKNRYTREGHIKFLQDYLDAKKVFYQSHPDLVYENFNKQLPNDRVELFIEPAKGLDSIQKMLNCDVFNNHSINPEGFAQALEHPQELPIRYVDVLIAQARELAFITDKPLAETMKERLLHAGLTPFQAGMLADVTHAYENNTHEQFLKLLKDTHGAEAARLAEERFGTIPKNSNPLAPHAANTPPPVVPSAAESETASVLGNAAEKAAGEGIVAREAEAARAGHNAGSSALKWGIVAATVAVGAVIGYWVWNSKQKETEKQTSKNQTASPPSR